MATTYDLDVLADGPPDEPDDVVSDEVDGLDEAVVFGTSVDAAGKLATGEDAVEDALACAANLAFLTVKSSSSLT